MLYSVVWIYRFVMCVCVCGVCVWCVCVCELKDHAEGNNGENEF